MKKQIKVFATLIIFALSFVLSALPASASIREYFMIEGYIGINGTAQISRIGLIEYENVMELEREGDYSLVALYQDELMYSVPINVSFDVVASDMPSQTIEYSDFVVYIPADIDVSYFFIVNSEEEIVGDYVAYTPYQYGIETFNVEETNTGYSLDWNVLCEQEYRDLLSYDVVAYSENTGEKYMLAYRTKEVSLTVPFEWLEPNDTIYFKLLSNDTITTFSESSSNFQTPDGKSMVITEEWQEFTLEDLSLDEDYEDDLESLIIGFVLIAIVFLLLILIAVVIILVIKLKKKQK